MTARELYTAARTMFPYAGNIYVSQWLQTSNTVPEGEVLETWSVSVSSATPSTVPQHDIGYGFGTTPEECLRKLREDGERKAREGKL